MAGLWRQQAGRLITTLLVFIRSMLIHSRENTHHSQAFSVNQKKKKTNKQNQTNIVHSAYELLLGILKVKPGAIRLIPSFLSSVMNPEKVTDPGFVVWNLYSLYRWVAIELHHSDFPSRETAAGILVCWQPPTAAPLSPLWHPYHGLASLWLFWPVIKHKTGSKAIAFLLGALLL